MTTTQKSGPRQAEILREYGPYPGMEWFGRRNETDLRVGAEIRSLSPEGELEWNGEILECDPPRLLPYTFQHTDKVEPPSRVTFEISAMGDDDGPAGDPVKLTITHDEFPEGSEVLQRVSNGWPGILAGIKTFLETGSPLGLK